MMMRAAFVLSLLLPFSALPAQGDTADVREERLSFKVNGENVAGTWHVPTSEGTHSFVFVQHGFMRNERNLDALAHALAQRGLAVASVNLNDSQMKSRAFIQEMARVLEENPPRPQLADIDPHYLLIGHSLGGNFLSRVGAAAVANESSHLTGMILLDPVEYEEELAHSLLTLKGKVPVLSILGEPNACNGNGGARKSIGSAALDFPGIHIVKGSHCDAEGESSNWTCSMICGGSKKENSHNLQEFATAWASGMADKSVPAEYLPGGVRFEALAGAGQIRPLR